MRILGCALLACLLGIGTAGAQEKEERGARPDHDLWGLETHPYIALNYDRVSSDTAAWTAGVTGGVEVDFDPFWIGVGYTVHDVLSDIQVVPWDGTAFGKLGLYQGGLGNLGQVPTYFHAAAVLAVPTGPDKLALGFEAGFEFDFQPIYAGLSYTLRDTWIDDDDEVYPWDNEFGVQLGLYF